MKRTLLGSLLALLGVLPFAASADDAYTTSSANLRAGPDASYPRIVTLPAGTRVELYGCINDWSWCDVSWRNERGWISGALLDYSYQGQRYGIYDYGPQLNVPILSFVFGTYWNNYYRERPWYRERTRWSQHRPVYRPRPPRPAKPPRPERPETPPPRPTSKPAPPPARPTSKPAPPSTRPTSKPAPPSTRPTSKPAPPSTRPTAKPAPPPKQPTAKPAPPPKQPTAKPQSPPKQPTAKPAPHPAPQKKDKNDKDLEPI